MKYKKLLTDFFKKPLFAQVILLIVLIGVIYFFKLSFNFSGSSPSGLATLIINFETEKRFFEGEVIKDMTILDALSASVLVGKIKLNYSIDKSNNISIVEIDGYTNGANSKYFVFYLNSKKVPIKNLNKEIVRNGDKIEIRNE